MTNIPPIFPIHQPHHFSDYGFHTQFDYFQVLELEARNHKHASSSSSFRSAINNLHFKLQKPISIDDKSKSIIKSRKRWWKKALRFFKRKRASSSNDNSLHSACTGPESTGFGPHALSGPVYLVESRNGRSTRYRNKRKGDLNIPYTSLSELNMDETHKISHSPMPIYLVT